MKEATKKLIDYLNEHDIGYEKYQDLVIIQNTLTNAQVIEICSTFKDVYFDGNRLSSHIK